MAQRIAADTILFFLNPQRVWEQPDVVQGIWNLRDVFKAGGQMLVLVTPPGPTLPVAFAAVSLCGGADGASSIEAFAYTRLAATISAAMRLMAIGQSDAHALLARTLDRVPTVAQDIIDRDAAIDSFAPAMDIAAMTHQYVHSRLFRS